MWNAKCSDVIHFFFVANLSGSSTTSAFSLVSFHYSNLTWFLLTLPLHLVTLLCLCACQTCRPAGGHVGRARQLQHHSQGAEAFLQQAARGERPLGESQSRRGPSVSLVWEGERISDTSRGAALRGCDHVAQTRKMVRGQTTTPRRVPIQGPPCIIDSGLRREQHLCRGEQARRWCATQSTAFGLEQWRTKGRKIKGGEAGGDTYWSLTLIKLSRNEGRLLCF